MKITDSEKKNIIGLTFLSALLLTACAVPHYEDATRSDANHRTESAQSSCRLVFLKSSLCLNWYWEQATPKSLQYASMIVVFYDLKNMSVIKAPENPLSVRLWMDSMNHGSSPTTVESLAPGVFRVSKIYFIMDRDWTVHFELGRGDATHFEEVVEQLWIDPS